MSEHLDHLCECFYRVAKSRSWVLGGLGVGLTIAEAIGGRDQYRRARANAQSHWLTGR